MKNIHVLFSIFLSLLISTMTVSAQDSLIIDFKNKDDLQQWRIVNDGVMGGLSRSEMKTTDSGTAIFSGIVSLENNGGFASIRTLSRPYKLNDFSGLILRIYGDGKTYQFRIRTNNRFDGVSYRYEFATSAESWMNIRIPFSNFVPVFRGRLLSDVPALSPENIQQLGFLIAGKQKGSFKLKIDWIKAYK